MTILHTTTLRSLTLLSCLALSGACANDEKGSSGGDDSASDDDTGSDPTEDGGDSAADSAGDSAADSAGDSAADSAGDEGGQTCDGDWTLGSVPFSGDPTLGQACDDPVAPKNCADGTYIKFPDARGCVCIAACSSGNKQVGDNCTDDGTWVCQHIVATNPDMNSANVCVNKNWGLCTDGSAPSTGGDPTGDSAGDSAGDSTSDSAGDSAGCAPSGSRCSFDDDCCSGSCGDDDLCA